MSNLLEQLKAMTTVVAAVVVNHRRDIDLSGHIQQKVNQMILGQPILW